ncbi:MAG: hypothetical protein QOE37_838, partial [Microbacteriaceae bacterium]|nr:hypothetical protein [Microbacteriaceae bacterium]
MVATALIVVGVLAGAVSPAVAQTPAGSPAHGSGALTAPAVERPAIRARTAATPLPAAVDLTQWAPAVGDQGPLGSCTSWAIGYTMAGWYANRLNRPTDFAPMFLYSQVHQSTAPDGGGQYTADVYRVAAAQGIAPRASYPQGDFDFRTKPTAAEVAAAAPYRLAPQITLYSGISAPGPAARALIEAQLAAGHPVEIAFPVYPAFDRLNAAHWTLHERDVQSDRAAGGHAVVVVGYDAGGVRIQNQWGTSWGQRGYADLGWDFVEQE